MIKTWYIHGRPAFLLIAGFVVAAGSPAYAIKNGTYSGQTADGHTITFQVKTDPNTGKPELGSLLVYFTAQCPQTADSYSAGYSWGFADGVDFVKSKVTWTYSPTPLFIYTQNTIAFTSTTAANGSTQFRVAALIPGTPPTKAEVCTSPKQAFTATYQGP